MKITANCKRRSKSSLPVPRIAPAAFAALVLLGACAHRGAAPTVRVASPPPAQPAAALTVAQRAQLTHRLDAIFAPFSASPHSLCVIDASQAPVYARGCSRALSAASVQKIIVAASALRYLGASYRFHTQLASQQAAAQGTLSDDLWLLGSGDPIFTSDDLRGGVKILARSGLRRVAGGVAVDGSVLSGPERNPLWDPTDYNYGFAASTSGVSLDQDTVEFHVHPTAAGAPARIELKPPARTIAFSGTVMTVGAGSPTEITIEPTGPADAFVVRGQIANAGHEAVYYVPVTRVADYVADVLETMLEARNIETARGPRTGIAPHNLSVLWDHKSPPLRFTVAKMLYESNNHIAEQLLRTIGRAQGGRGDDAHGIAAEIAFLRGTGVPLDGIHVVDGSGLAAANRVSALTLATLLARAERAPGGNTLYFALPRGGIEGTLKRYPFGAARGRVRAKSGHIDGVASLAGYVSTRRHGRLVFAYVLDAPVYRDTADAVLVRAVDALADF